MRMLQLVHLHFAGCVVEINEPDHVAVTIFPDGTRSAAAPNYEPDDLDRARELGYRSTWEMTREHEIGHAVLSAGRSPTVWRDAHPDLPRLDHMVWSHEESAVIAWQRFRVAAYGVNGSLRELYRDFGG